MHSGPRPARRPSADQEVRRTRENQGALLKIAYATGLLRLAGETVLNPTTLVTGIMSNLARAISLAAAAHVDQREKSGAPYILHPIRVMLRMNTEAEMMVAVLHDVVEDTTVTFDQLRKEGFSEEVLAALDCVTRRSSETYAEFVDRARDNPVARKVKVADLEDNMDARRLPEITEKSLERLKKYHQAWMSLRAADRVSP